MRWFGADTVDWLRTAAAEGARRGGLAAGLRAREGWSDDAGAPCLSPARIALPEIARRCGIGLPPSGALPDWGGAGILAVRDTTMPDHSGIGDSTEGLAKPGGGGAGGVGVPVHVTFAVPGAGRGPGVPGIDADFRRAAGGPEREESESRRWPAGLDLARRPGRACPGTRAFAVCGREGDIWDMSGAQAGDPDAAGPWISGSTPPPCPSSGRGTSASQRAAARRRRKGGRR